MWSLFLVCFRVQFNWKTRQSCNIVYILRLTLAKFHDGVEKVKVTIPAKLIRVLVIVAVQVHQ